MQVRGKNAKLLIYTIVQTPFNGNFTKMLSLKLLAITPFLGFQPIYERTAKRTMNGQDRAKLTISMATCAVLVHPRIVGCRLGGGLQPDGKYGLQVDSGVRTMYSRDDKAPQHAVHPLTMEWLLFSITAKVLEKRSWVALLPKRYMGTQTYVTLFFCVYDPVCLAMLLSESPVIPCK